MRSLIAFIIQLIYLRPRDCTPNSFGSVHSIGEDLPGSSVSKNSTEIQDSDTEEENSAHFVVSNEDFSKINDSSLVETESGVNSSQM